MSETTPGPEGRQNTTLHIIVLVVVTVACLLPFVDKAFHIDDPLFVWTARNILDKPLDFYGFSVNWDSLEGRVMLMSEITKNPPIASYYTALVASVAGFGEKALHIAFFLPAIGFITGVYVLARRFTLMPFQAALATAFTPVFLVSATTVMSDVMMLAFWCWAIVLWLRGAERGEPVTMLCASVLIALSALTKYFGVSLIPLLVVYSLLKGYSLRRWAPWLLVPIAILAGYQWATHEMYGRGLLFDAVSYAGDMRSFLALDYLNNSAIALIFAGGCVMTAFFYAPLAWSRRSLGLWVLLMIIIGFALFLKGTVFNWWLSAQIVIFVVVGVNLLAIAIVDLLRRRDAASVLLFLWIVGTFIFAGFINWTNNGRSILPMAPAAAILLMRRVEDRSWASADTGGWRVLLPLVPSLILSFIVAKGDYSLANASRTAAAYVHEQYAQTERIWFQGHWGFQYYMEEAGAKAIDWRQSTIRSGDIIVTPLNSTGTRRLPENSVLLIDDQQFDVSEWATTMDLEIGAGFYASVLGPMPYAIGPTNKERYKIYLVR